MLHEKIEGGSNSPNRKLQPISPKELIPDPQNPRKHNRAQVTRRCAYDIELDPLYVDTAVMRWQQMSKQVVRLSTGEILADLGNTREVFDGSR